MESQVSLYPITSRACKAVSLPGERGECGDNDRRHDVFSGGSMRILYPALKLFHSSSCLVQFAKRRRLCLRWVTVTGHMVGAGVRTSIPFLGLLEEKSSSFMSFYLTLGVARTDVFPLVPQRLQLLAGS